MIKWEEVKDGGEIREHLVKSKDGGIKKISLAYITYPQESDKSLLWDYPDGLNTWYACKDRSTKPQKCLSNLEGLGT